MTAPVPAPEPTLRVPLVEETVEVGRRTVVTGRVRIDKTVETTEATIDEPLRREVLQTERRRVDRMLDPDEPLPQPRHEGDTWIVPVLEEVLVVERRTVLREELLVRRTSEAYRAPQRVELRSERIDVRRLDADASPSADPVPPVSGGVQDPHRGSPR
ncbi:MAG TPA: DUF2382 domain-containing protein [Burkholderiaceae bacterium]|nr:DUF2382 domain-containing protein [Burkholderiaceae bacterium]